MFRQSANPIYSRSLLNSIITALSTNPAAALIVTPFVHLFTAGPTPITPDSVAADFTEATFVGYAPEALALPLLGPANYPNNLQGSHNEVDFTAGAVALPGETIIGYWIDDDDTAPTKLYAAELFIEPVGFVNLGDFLSLDVSFVAACYQTIIES